MCWTVIRIGYIYNIMCRQCFARRCVGPGKFNNSYWN